MSIHSFIPNFKGQIENVHYELADNRWFGNRTRGKEALANRPATGPELSPEDFIRYLIHEIPEARSGIEWIKFYEHLDGRGAGEWRLRFAVCYTVPRFEFRRSLFDAGQRVTDETGWYPLVLGRRFRAPNRRRNIPLPKTRRRGSIWELGRSIRFGKLVEIRSATRRGNSILFQFEHSSLLLDFGLDFQMPASGVPALGVLTHIHEDHAGGLTAALDAGIAVLLSEGAYRQLIEANRISPNEDLCYPVTLPFRVYSADRTEIRLIAGAHIPGTSMALITDTHHRQVLYPGDYSLQNAYYQLKPNDLLRHFLPTSHDRTLLVDGAFLGNTELQENSVTALTDLEHNLLMTFNRNRSTVFLSNDAENLYVLYIWFFHKILTKAKQFRPLVIGRQLQQLLESTFAEIYFRRKKRQDAFISNLLNKSDANYIETVRLYFLVNGNIPRGLPFPFDVFCLFDNTFPKLMTNVPDDVTFFVVGRRNAKIAALCQQQLSAKDVRFLDGPDFTFHSRPRDVAAIINAAAEKNVRPVVFHSTSARAKSALGTLGVEESSYECLIPPAGGDLAHNTA